MVACSTNNQSWKHMPTSLYYWMKSRITPPSFIGLNARLHLVTTMCNYSYLKGQDGNI